MSVGEAGGGGTSDGRPFGCRPAPRRQGIAAKGDKKGDKKGGKKRGKKRGKNDGNKKGLGMAAESLDVLSKKAW
ncbi:hypothetical protein ACIPRI_14325 [Variovorax sp. LARHSF232]